MLPDTPRPPPTVKVPVVFEVDGTLSVKLNCPVTGRLGKLRLIVPGTCVVMLILFYVYHFYVSQMCHFLAHNVSHWPFDEYSDQYKKVL